MSWLSDTVDKVRKDTDNLGKKLGMGSTARRYFRTGVASMGGGMGLQYEYSRNKGMNSDEATKNATTGGMQYAEARGMQKARAAKEAEEQAAADMERQRVAEETKARGQIAARVRRSQRADRPANKSGTLVTGGLGTTGTGPTTFAALLGL